MMQFVVWYILISLLGLAIFPITRRIFKKGAAQGFFYSRIVALFLWGFFYWFLGIMQIIPVGPSGVLLILIGLFAGSFLISNRSIQEEYITPLKEHKTAVLTGEVLFLMAFLFMILLKSMYPNLDHTEKPMEMAFINAILHSPTFPPRDPWLSGYAISYYYFGYVIVSLLITATGVDPAIGFNLAISMWYGLSALVIYGIVYQLLHDWRKRIQPEADAIKWSDRKGTAYALIAPVLALFSGNFEGLLELLYAKGLFWTTQADGIKTSAFWQWLDITDLKSAPVNTSTIIPSRSNWWWWQASRVLQDYDVQGVAKEIIDEFPFFSYFLGDLHPHVLAMPFVLTAVALCYMVFLRLKDIPATENLVADASKIIAEPEFLWTSLFTLVFIGGISFLNTWDFPVYFGLLMLVILFWRIQGVGWSSKRLLEMIYCGLICGVISLILYLPFFVSFASQAGGILPSLVYFTTGKQLWIFFGGLLVPLFIWLIWLNNRSRKPMNVLRGMLIAFATWIGMFLFSVIVGVIGLSTTNLFLTDTEFLNLGGRIYNAQGYGGTTDILIETFLGRIESPFAWITLVLLFGLIIGLFVKRKPEETSKKLKFSNENNFVLMVVGVGLGLIAFPEFFYLLDNFGWRMNTIFKFYYQAWLLLSIGAAFAMIVVLDQVKGLWKYWVRSITVLAMLVVLVYPSLATYYRFFINHNEVSTLDGMYHIRQYNPLEAEAIDWLREAPDGIVVEAVGGSYRADFGKISTHSGLPTILGWPGHEGQWRGGYNEIGGREEDVNRIYQLHDWDETKALLDQYNVRYIYIGTIEQTAYRVEETKFNNHLSVVFQNDLAIIYEYTPEYLLSD
ncbi:MAG: hypothetical protein JEZ00_02580 [Anaerolineaceae bacterium]|nr:hypothetical protein [Anaerolineaceae bacterium]